MLRKHPSPIEGLEHQVLKTLEKALMPLIVSKFYTGLVQNCVLWASNHLYAEQWQDAAQASLFSVCQAVSWPGFFGCHLLPAIKGWLQKDIHLSCNWTFIKIAQEALEVAGWMVVGACFTTGKNPVIQQVFVIWELSIAGLVSWKSELFFSFCLCPSWFWITKRSVIQNSASFRPASGKKIQLRLVHAGCLWLVENFLFRPVRQTGIQAATGSGKKLWGKT